VELGNKFGPKILAIGGAVIKTHAYKTLAELVDIGEIQMLIHNGGSIFHDFQLATDKGLQARGITSYPLDELLVDYSVNEAASHFVWDWIIGEAEAPEGSLTQRCEANDVPVLMFTVLGADFWQLFEPQGLSWANAAERMEADFSRLCTHLSLPFHYICMGSAVIHPEVFVKALAVVGRLSREFRADVVDFLDMYRPRTRVAKYGHYYQMEHCDFAKMWLEEAKSY